MYIINYISHRDPLVTPGSLGQTVYTYCVVETTEIQEEGETCSKSIFFLQLFLFQKLNLMVKIS